VLSNGMALARLPVLFMGGLSVVALLLTATGLYGLLSYAVQRRTREIGVRVALGAPRSTIVAMVVRQVLTLAVTGLALGSVGAIAADIVLRRQLGVGGPSTALLLAIACSLVALTAASAAYLPARRAASVNPVEALRNE
jgi:macrolide transport system ATP-binding/permease protein